MKKVFILSSILFCCALLFADVTIVANPGNFPSIEKAAYAEKQVDFWDADKTDERACSESFAAVELKNFLIKVTDLKDTDIKFASPDKMPAKGDIFLLGSEASNKLIAKYSEGKNLSFNSDESFNIRTTKDDSRTITIIEGSDRVGTMYGVYEYLNKLGIRFFGLGEDGTAYPENKVSLLGDVDITHNPDYLTRGFWITSNPKPDPNEMHLWMARNKLNFWTMQDSQVHKVKKLGFILCVGEHVNQLLYIHPKHEYPYNCEKFEGDEDKPKDPYKPSDQYQGDKNNDGKLSYFEAHPQWYGLIDGKRSDHFAWNGHNFCTANIDAATEFGKNMAESIADGKWKYADVVNFWMFDTHYGWCNCDKCKGQGIETDRFLRLVDVVFEEIDKVRKQGRLSRKVLISPLAYQETIYPPTKPLPEGFNYDDCLLTFFPIGRCYAHTISDNSCTEVNQSLCDSFYNWSIDSGRLYKGGIFIGEYYNVSSLMSLPVVYPKIMSSDIPWYFKKGARHFNYMHSPIVRWGTWTLNQYLMARLLWDVDVDSEAVLDEFYRLYYPTTYKTTKEFYHCLEKATANIKAFKHFITLGGDHRFYLTQSWAQCLTNKDKPIFWVDHLTYEPKEMTTNDTLSIVEMLDEMDKARQYIDESLLSCSDEKEQARLMAAERRFDYGEKMYKFLYHLVRTSMFFHQDNDIVAKVEFAKAKIYADILKSITDMANVTCGGNIKNAFKATQAVEAYEFFEKKYGN
ncbi:MAG: DUF4838 domain-containing protein [Planctomycetes bacterium]|nr:DUF4838 domain-containing protein [Planctomycetota bacterium]